MPTAITPQEGRQVMANLIFKQSDGNRGASLELGLFTNTVAMTETSVLGDVTEPTGGTYARITLTDASWAIGAAGLAEYAKQTFFADGSAFSDDITGFFIASTGTAPKLVHFQIEDTPIPVAANESYSVTPKINLTSV